jgi:hypothetical protein
MLCLSGVPHPRDKRACLPKVSSPHSVRSESVVAVSMIFAETKLRTRGILSNFFKEISETL